MKPAVSVTKLNAVWIFALTLCACLIDTSGLSGGSTSADAGSKTAPPVSPPPIVDAGTDSAGDVCVPVLSTRDAGAIAPAGFSLAGAASIEGTSVRLTPDTGSQAGTLWSNETAFFDHFDMTAGFQIESAGQKAADGFAFAWVNQMAVPALQSSGAGLGIDGLTGFAVVVDEYGVGYPVSAPLVALVDLTKSATAQWTIAAQTIHGPIVDGAEHFLHVQLASGAVTVLIDDEIVLDHATLTGYGAYTGRWGFGAGTGESSASHRITRVSFVDPSTSCDP